MPSGSEHPIDFAEGNKGDLDGRHRVPGPRQVGEARLNRLNGPLCRAIQPSLWHFLPDVENGPLSGRSELARPERLYGMAVYITYWTE